MKLSYDPKYNVAYILLNANEQLTGDQGALIVESGGRRQKIPLVA
jgi:uncharacterized protein YuzE